MVKLKREPLNIILLGDPASGKGTQSMRLAKKYNLLNFDMGHEVRKPAIRAKFDFAKTTGSGKLTPTAIVRDILHRVIHTTPRTRGILFNGHPKMIGEARLAAGWLKEYHRQDPIVLYLHIPAQEILRRAAKRDRQDDSRQALVNRRRYYRDQVARTINFFKRRYRFKKISGIGTEAEVAKRIGAVVEALRKQHEV
jgi:adenylate kinase